MAPTKTSVQQLAADLAAVPRFLQEEWEVLSHYERVELIRQAAALPVPERVLLLGTLFEKLESPVFQAQILSCLDFASSGSEVPQFLLGALRSPNSRIRANAVEALAGIRTKPLQEGARPLLEDEDNRVRANACIYLWGYDTEREHVRCILEAMGASHDPWTRASAVYAAGKLLDPSFDELLVRALDDEYEPSCVAAVHALVARSYPHLVRRAAAFLKDTRPSTALWHAAADALEALQGRGPDVEDGALHALANTGDRALQTKLLSILGRQESPTVAGKILDFLERLDAGEYHLCHELLEAVGSHGLPEHRARLQALAKSRLAIYSDILARASKAITKRNRRWWPI